MRKFAVILALLALLFTDMALAAGAIVTSITGSATVQAGTAPARTLRQGDEVKQGETVKTAVASAVVMRFDDGQIAAMTGNSTMTVAAYQYNAETSSGNVFLDLVSGGMRAITGLIGRRNPTSVAYRAGAATIGIRGTDVDISTADGLVGVVVNDGTISFTFNGKTIILAKGEGLRTLRNGQTRSASPGQVIADLRADNTPGANAVADALETASSVLIWDAINSAARQSNQGNTGNQGDQGNAGNQGTGSTGGAQGSGGTGGGAGGGGASPGTTGTASGS